jgi:hypothetical protein
MLPLVTRLEELLESKEMMLEEALALAAPGCGRLPRFRSV